MNKPKTICIVSPYPPPLGGMAIQAQKMGRLLKESGYDVIAVKTNADIPESFGFLSKIKGIRTIVTVLFFLKNLNNALNHTSVVYFLTGFFDFFFWVTYPGLLLIKLRKKRVILSVRGGGAREFFEKYKTVLAPIFSRIDTFTAPSGFLREVFKEFFNIEPVLVPNIADLEQFKYKDRKKIQPRIIVTRSLEDIYNVECVIRAFNLIHDQYPRAMLGIVGDGSKRNELEDLVKKLNLTGSITFYGRVEHSKIQNYYADYDIFMNASKVDNLPGTILEAFACGLPVITTNPGGIPYMLEDDKTGILVKNNDYHALAEKAIELLKSPEKANFLAKNAREEIYAYSWEKIKIVLSELL